MENIAWLREPWEHPEYWKWHAKLSEAERHFVEGIEDVCDDWAAEVETIYSRCHAAIQEAFRECRDLAWKNRIKREKEAEQERRNYVDGVVHEYAETQSYELKVLFAWVIYRETRRNWRSLPVYSGGKWEEIERPEDWRMAMHIYATSLRFHPDFGFKFLLNINNEQICDECR